MRKRRWWWWMRCIGGCHCQYTVEEREKKKVRWPKERVWTDFFFKFNLFIFLIRWFTSIIEGGRGRGSIHGGPGQSQRVGYLIDGLFSLAPNTGWFDHFIEVGASERCSTTYLLARPIHLYDWRSSNRYVGCGSTHITSSFVVSTVE